MKKAQIITIVNHKGGVGKTTTAINLGIGLAHSKKKVLIIDLDPQANLTQSMGILDEQPQTIYGALRGTYSLPTITLNGIDITPSELNLCGAEIELTAAIGREFILRDLLTEEQQTDNIIIHSTKGILQSLIYFGYIEIFSLYNGKTGFVYRAKKKIEVKR